MPCSLSRLLSISRCSSASPMQCRANRAATHLHRMPRRTIGQSAVSMVRRAARSGGRPMDAGKVRRASAVHAIARTWMTQQDHLQYESQVRRAGRVEAKAWEVPTELADRVVPKDLRARAVAVVPAVPLVLMARAVAVVPAAPMVLMARVGQADLAVREDPVAAAHCSASSAWLAG